MSHYLVITDDGHDGSFIHGIYPSFEEARDETERRIAEDKARQYAREYIDRAEIQQWTGEHCDKRWEHESRPSFIWVERTY